MLKIIKDFICYIKNPKDELDKDQSLRNKLSTLFSLLLLSFVFNALYFLFLSFLEYFNIISSSGHAFEAFLAENHILYVIIIAVLIAPWFEEFTFRYFLRLQPNRIYSFVYKTISFVNVNTAEFLKKNLRLLWQNYFKWLFYSSAVLFGLIHLFNFTDSNTAFLLLPLLIVTQILGGLIFAYLRVRFSFNLAFIAHALYNLSIIIFILLIEAPTTDVVKISNEDFDLHIEKLNYSLKSSYRIDAADNEYKLYKNSLGAIVRNLKQTDAQYFETNDQAETEWIFNLNYTAHSPEAFEFKQDTILKYFGAVYNFKVKDISIVKDVYVLRIKDHKSLNRHRTTDSILSFSSNINKIEIKAGSLQTLASSLSSRSKTEIIVKDSLSDRFNFALPTNLALMKQSLNAYGLEIIEDKADLQTFFIEFDK